jgi:predicted dienelactone hydrolase
VGQYKLKGADCEEEMFPVRSAAILFTLILSGLAGSGSFDVQNPQSPGPFPVGVTTKVFIDSSRTDALTKEPRTLVTEIWYPATDNARTLPKASFTDFIPGGVTPELEFMLKAAYKLTSADLNRGFSTVAARDAKIRDGRFPLVLFSHGNRGLRFQNTFWCDYLASHGYIVVSPDHTGNAGLTIIKGKLVLYQGTERDRSAEDRPKDLAFIIDQLTSLNARASSEGDSRFMGKLDLEKIAASGMSFGSYTAIKLADRDPRVKAVIGMAYAPPEGHTNVAIPTLLMLGEEDQTIEAKGNAAIRSNFEAHRGPTLLLELKRGGHFSFTDMFKINPNHGDGVGTGKRKSTGETITFASMETTYGIINSYSVAFLGAYLRGDKEYLKFLVENAWPKELEMKSKGM